MTGNVITVLFKMTSRWLLGKVVHLHWVAAMCASATLLTQGDVKDIFSLYQKLNSNVNIISHRHKAPK